MTDPLRDALRECEAYFEERADAEYNRLLVAVQAALRTQPQLMGRLVNETTGGTSQVDTLPQPAPRIASDEMVERVARAVCNAAWADVHENWEDASDEQRVDFRECATAALAAMEPSK